MRRRRGVQHPAATTTTRNRTHTLRNDVTRTSGGRARQNFNGAHGATSGRWPRDASTASRTCARSPEAELQALLDRGRPDSAFGPSGRSRCGLPTSAVARPRAHEPDAGRAPQSRSRPRRSWPARPARRARETRSGARGACAPRCSSSRGSRSTASCRPRSSSSASTTDGSEVQIAVLGTLFDGAPTVARRARRSSCSRIATAMSATRHSRRSCASGHDARADVARGGARGRGSARADALECAGPRACVRRGARDASRRLRRLLDRVRARRELGRPRAGDRRRAALIRALARRNSDRVRSDAARGADRATLREPNDAWIR